MPHHSKYIIQVPGRSPVSTPVRKAIEYMHRARIIPSKRSFGLLSACSSAGSVGGGEGGLTSTLTLPVLLRHHPACVVTRCAVNGPEFQSRAEDGATLEPRTCSFTGPLPVGEVVLVVLVAVR